MSKATNNFIRATIVLSLLVCGVMLMPSQAAAQQQINVDFETEPLFEAGNFLPGDTTIKNIDVENLSGSEQTVYVGSHDVDNDDNLGDRLQITIEEPGGETGNLPYTATLSELFANGEVELSDLSAGASTTYTFAVAFAEAAGNEYQGKTLGFDICVGFSGGQMSCGDTQAGEQVDGDGPSTASVTSTGGSGPPPNRQPGDQGGEGGEDGRLQEVAGAATSTDSTDNPGGISESLVAAKEALQGLLTSLEPDDAESEPTVSGTVAGAQTSPTPGLPDTGAGSDFGWAAVAFSLLLFTLAITARAFLILYRVFTRG